MNVAKHQKTATFNYVCSQLNQAAKVTPTPYAYRVTPRPRARRMPPISDIIPPPPRARARAETGMCYVHGAWLF